MKRSELNPMPVYFDRYINLADDVELMDALQISLQELENVPIEKWKALGEKVYEPGKWTIKDLLQHVIDTERVFVYRATSFARKDEQKMLGYDEELFSMNAQANRRMIDDLLEELILLRKSTILMFRSFTDEMLQTLGKSYNSEYSAASIGFMLSGHQRWHLKVLEERYFPLLDN
ncbi:MAG: DinB family protein [Saprospirales bacterium]|nr:DinB family protein [Saprospirales bacterium]